ncbi:MAG: hypothetical protein CME06_04810 [Gemmatimonadetes bacterium]|nr:hypothetical protein [Gemmatimonadota bacterium]
MSIKRRRALALATLTLSLAFQPALAGNETAPAKPQCCAAAKGKTAAQCEKQKAECLHALGKAGKAECKPKADKLAKQCCIDAVNAGKDPCCDTKTQNPG